VVLDFFSLTIMIVGAADDALIQFLKEKEKKQPLQDEDLLENA
jgi:hypothetical protein